MGSDKMGSETLRERLESIVETYNPLLKPRSDKSMSISEEIIPSLSKLNQNKVCKLKKPSFYGPKTDLAQPLFLNAKTMSSSTPMIKKLTEALSASSPCVDENPNAKINKT